MKKLGVLLLVLGFISFLVFCSINKKLKKEESLRSLYERPIEEWPSPVVDEGVSFTDIGILPKPKTTPQKEMVNLGKVLFFDPRLSKSNTLACASCHSPEMNWTDLREKSFGHERNIGKRNAMSLENIWAQPGPFFWDGRAKTLEDQILFPIQDHLEMAQDLDKLVNELDKIDGYKPLFTAAYGDQSITIERIQEAIVSFELTITSKKTRFDHFVLGSYDRLTDQEIRGLHLFRTKAKCMNCHHGPLFSDFDFHNEGQHHLGRPSEDVGLYAVSQNIEDIGKFKTPSLRNVMNTKPWMHNGLFDNMEGILKLYNKGMLRPDLTATDNATLPLPKTDTLLHSLHLTNQEIEDLEAFLHTLSSPPNRVRPPKLP